MRNPDIVSTNCPCGAVIRHHKDDTPSRCVLCHKKFVSSDDVVVVEGQNPPTIVKVNPVNVSSKAKGAN